MGVVLLWIVVVAGKAYAAKDGAVGVIKETRNTRRFFVSFTNTLLLHFFYISIINLIMVIIYIILKKKHGRSQQKRKGVEDNTRKKKRLTVSTLKKKRKKNYNESANITNYNTVFFLYVRVNPTLIK